MISLKHLISIFYSYLLTLAVDECILVVAAIEPNLLSVSFVATDWPVVVVCKHDIVEPLRKGEEEKKHQSMCQENQPNWLH